MIRNDFMPRNLNSEELTSATPMSGIPHSFRLECFTVRDSQNPASKYAPEYHILWCMFHTSEINILCIQLYSI